MEHSSIVWELAALLALLLSAFVLWSLVRAPLFALNDKRKRFHGRAPLNPQDFYRTFYQDSRIPEEVVVQLRGEIAKITGIHESLLRPEDRFLEELSVGTNWKHFDDSPDELFFETRRREKRLGVKIEIANFKTLDEYIRKVGSLEAEFQQRENSD